MTRLDTGVTALLRRGLHDLDAARRVLEDWPAAGDVVLDGLATLPDPDLALAGVDRLCREVDGLLERLAAEPVLRRQLLAVLGASQALGMHLQHHPHLVEDLAHPVGLPGPDDLGVLAEAVADQPTPAAAADALRLAYRRVLLRIAAVDLTAPRPVDLVPDVSEVLARLAETTLQVALDVAAREVEGTETVRLAVVGLGKCGAAELNYVSDVDVLFVAEPALDADGEPLVGVDAAVATGTRWAAAMTRICSAHSAAGTIWEVDAALRPEGKAGPLVRTLASMRGYYERWAKPWEFQAMLKARPVAGDSELGQQFCDLVAPLVWRVGETPGFVAATQAMRRRVIDLIPAREAGREIKLGEGGLRDVEFSVQLLQLVHGRTDETLRVRSTLEGLGRLVEGGYIGRADGDQLGEAYRFERLLEHRVQLFRLRRSHLLPTDEAELRRLARSVGLRDAEAVNEAWLTTSRQVQVLHRRLFYSPLLAAVASIPSEQLRLSAEGARDRLSALGFLDADGALRDIERLSRGMSRSADIQRQLLPAMLGWFAEAPNPDAGLRAFGQVSAALGSTSWYLRALRDEGAMAQRLARILASSRYATALLRRSPEAVQMLAKVEDLAPRNHGQLCEATRSSARRHDDPAKAVAAVRSVRRRELFRIAAADVLGLVDVEQVGRAVTDISTATVEAALDVARRDAGAEAVPLALVALGRWGGQEMSYASDADAMFVVGDELDEQQLAAARTAVTRLREHLARPGPDPALVVDADLRPEGKGGPMVRSVSSYRQYYERWSSPWEAQAMIRATVGAGDAALAEQVLAAVAPLRWPEGGLDATQRREIRRLKARMEAERLPRGARPERHTKLGPGGLSDVEWTVQMLQLEHAHRLPALRTTETLGALRAAREADLLGEADARTLEEAWLLASRVRNTVMLVRGRASDTFPTDPVELTAVAELLGYGHGGGSHLLEHYRRLTRRCRAVVDRVFWGEG
ncbi:bifunctional [glutamine synthetase] adenylyltransferase/[glutamine synthetase]-adenylyl-L-tyrosine phosphorylase [Desertihabitans brevis]|uniref:Bifunctional [glutamine synthetase] adenylyltransferase/[glutamine synthetase]-adenylyl-L-tyrosine phosphorylase n=1 Tax=Desertihabitans brevis TaxID=2268447 RepID=A0A367YUD7_9ACTN|nr:bifunctional [glutamine synthetase] adenylyltransferase/[glutamine synthetase]-adenylyl-L-tyrosine phosphorylase [Desertihabitans brevis]RCK69496.1 bifunctional [glutamine synthetase] adenylyltransferase/[glutamine synthetase]-adenylyl-L-tyrosine phosphorylase [Desertihabitans brevis]